MSDNPEDQNRLAEQVAEALFARDHASQGYGMRLEEISHGQVRLSMRVRADMLNGQGLCHGGALYALGDTAANLASNSRNRNNLAAAGYIEFLAPAEEGDVLHALASETLSSGRRGVFDVVISNQREEVVAALRARSAWVGGDVLAQQ